MAAGRDPAKYRILFVDRHRCRRIAEQPAALRIAAGQQVSGEAECQRRFADPARPGKNPSMGETAGARRVEQNVLRRFMPFQGWVFAWR